MCIWKLKKVSTLVYDSLDWTNNWSIWIRDFFPYVTYSLIGWSRSYVTWDKKNGPWFARFKEISKLQACRCDITLQISPISCAKRSSKSFLYWCIASKYQTVGSQIICVVLKHTNSISTSWSLSRFPFVMLACKEIDWSWMWISWKVIYR